MYRTTSLLIFALLVGVLAMLLWPHLAPMFRPAAEPADVDVPAPQPIGATAAAEGARPPRLEGAFSPDAAPRRLRGQVTLEEGTSPLLVSVYLLPKGVEGAATVEHAVQPDEEGRFDLGEVDPGGHWIAAMAQDLEPEYRPTFVDGDTWDGAQLVLRLRAGRVVRVRVAAETGATLPAGVRAIATPTRTGTQWVFPGPDATVDFTVRKAVSAEGEAEIRLPTAGKVRVRVEAAHHRSEPTDMVLGSEERLAAFRMHGVGSLVVETTDGETGASLDHRSTVTVLSLATGREVVATRAALLPRWMSEHGLRPGRYALLVRAPGYLPTTVPEVEVERPGGESEAAVALSLDPGAGIVHLTLLLPAGESLAERHLHVEGRRRSARRPEDRAWQRLSPRAVDAGRGTLTVGPLDLGDWELVVWAGPARVGRTEVVIKGGFPDEAEVLLQAGLLVDLLDVLPKGASGEDEVFVQPRRPDGDAWPVVRFRSRQRLIGIGGGAGGGPTERVERGGIVPQNAVLGPYPSEEVRIHVLRGETWEPVETVRAE